MGKGRKLNKKASGTLRHRHLTACISCAEIELPPRRVVHSVCHECDSFWLLAHLSCTRLLDAVQINSRIERARERNACFMTRPARSLFVILIYICPGSGIESESRFKTIRTHAPVRGVQNISHCIIWCLPAELWALRYVHDS